MAKRKYKMAEEVVDTNTGEVTLTSFFTIVDKDEGYDFVKVYRAFTRKVMADLQGKESVKARMLWWFVDQLQDRPYGKLQIYASTTELACQLNCSIISIKKARAFLVKEGYITKYMEKVSRKTARNYYELNPKYVHKGREIK